MNYTIMVLAAYAVIMIAATVLMTNKEKSVERFCVGNRNIHYLKWQTITNWRKRG